MNSIWLWRPCGRRAASILMAFCLGLSSCQRPAQDLPTAPMFWLPAEPLRAQQVEPAPVVVEPVAAPFAGATIIYFDRDSVTLDAAARGVLDMQAEWLLQNPRVTATLRGHADLLGNRGRQFAIGEMRAAAMRRHLAARGVASGRIQITSFGKEKPVATALDQESQRRNRRGETIFKGVAGQ
jgi:peptidoglycan-associated lipoprotein